MFNTPILFVAFNRPNETHLVFEEIRKIAPTKLYVALDAPRESYPSDLENCIKVKEIVSSIDWKCDFHLLSCKTNLGCFKAVSGAINWFFENEEQGIILEDDCLPSKDFFTFCEEMLYRYKNDERIISINGCNFGFELNSNNSYTFSKYMNMWGWATWRRSSTNIDYDINNWLKIKYKKLFLYNRLRNSLFDIDLNWIELWFNIFQTLSKSKNKTTWDWQWLFHQFNSKQYSVVPGVNLVSNIGFNNLATHTLDKEHSAANIPVYPLCFPLIHPNKVVANTFYENNYVKRVWCSYNSLPKLFYIKKFIKLFLQRVKIIHFK